MASVVQQSINRAFESLGLASSTSTHTAQQQPEEIKVSSQDAISLEEEYSAHK